MPNTYTLLETVTVGAAGASSVTFNSIPQTGYTDLVIKVSARSTFSGVSAGLGMQVNGLTTSIYTMKLLQGNGTNATSNSYSSITFISTDNGLSAATSTASTFNNAEIYIPNYLSSNNKSVSIDSVAENNATTGYNVLNAGLIATTAAINSVTLFSGGSANFAQHSTFSLYGVSALGVTPTKAPKATGGSIIQTDGTYWYHAFLSSGTFTPATALTCDVLVVAGGGGGGAGNFNLGGGGGTGGVFYATSQSVGTSAQTVTVGGGGAGGVFATFSAGSSGTNSSLASLTSGVGGGGGGAGGGNGVNGGSGGGAGAGSSGIGGTSTQTGTGGTGYGFAGGANVPSSAGAGGGGASAVGQNAAVNVGGNGGAGLNTWSSWLSTTGLGVSGYVSGGGGGAGVTTRGTGGSGGGGAGAVYGSTAPVAGTANTGSGGGGGGDTTAPIGAGAAGGSGLVIIRYLA